MSDFDVAPAGYMREITLSRALANQIANAINEKVELPLEVVQAYNRLYDEYIRQQQEEIM
jgi:hypothetical protein